MSRRTLRVEGCGGKRARQRRWDRLGRARRCVEAWPALLVLTSCGTTGVVPANTPIALERSCPADEAFDGKRCVRLSADLAALERGAAALTAFDGERALALLGEAAEGGPYKHRDHMHLYENLGIAHAYLGAEEASISAFDRLLALSPGHAVSYTLSPKVTFLFERARARASERATPGIRVSWPRDLSVDRPVPLDIQVVADPLRMLARARLFSRVAGTKAFTQRDFALRPRGDYLKLTLPAPAPAARNNRTLEIYLIGFDSRGNEVFTWGDDRRPNQLELAYQPPKRWYQRWWVWALAGGIVAGATGAGVYAATHEPPSTVDADVVVR